MSCPCTGVLSVSFTFQNAILFLVVSIILHFLNLKTQLFSLPKRTVPTPCKRQRFLSHYASFVCLTNINICMACSWPMRSSYVIQEFCWHLYPSTVNTLLFCCMMGALCVYAVLPTVASLKALSPWGPKDPTLTPLPYYFPKARCQHPGLICEIYTSSASACLRSAVNEHKFNPVIYTKHKRLFHYKNVEIILTN